MIISFPKAHFQGNEQQLPLSKLMIATLIAACEKQYNGIPFGPRDVGGSFTALITRGLLDSKKITVNGKTESTWHVTKGAVELLKALGIEVRC